MIMRNKNKTGKAREHEIEMKQGIAKPDGLRRCHPNYYAGCDSGTAGVRSPLGVGSAGLRVSWKTRAQEAQLLGS